MELQDWRKEPRKKYSNEFKLRMVELASQPGACVAQIARENGVELLPVEITPDEQKELNPLQIRLQHMSYPLKDLHISVTPATSQIRVPDGSEIIFPSRSVRGSTP